MVKAKIYTRAGDGGETRRVGGGRVRKDSRLIVVYGTLDELNAFLGLVRARAGSHKLIKPALKREIAGFVLEIQHDLFKLGSCFCSSRLMSRRSNLSVKTRRLEKRIDLWERKLPPLRSFLLPGADVISALIHVARTIARRAEREVVALEREEALPAGVLAYLNRLSDALFVLARYTSHQLGENEVLVKKGRKL